MQVPYVVSKFGVRGLTKAAAAELGPEGIRVSSVHPGIVATEMTGNPAEWYPLNVVPLRRVAQPDELTGMVAFLASDEASFITDGEFVVDGGKRTAPTRSTPGADVQVRNHTVRSATETR